MSYFINDLKIENVITIRDFDIIELSQDPTLSPGVASPIGSLAVVQDEVNEKSALYQKTGPLDTDWTLILDKATADQLYLQVTALSSNISLYATTASSDVVGYNKLVTSLEDPDYDAVAVDVSTGVISSDGQLVGQLISEPGLIIGNPGIININTIGNIRKVSGSKFAEFYYEVYKRNSGGVETLIADSAPTVPVESTSYEQFFEFALLNNGIFTETDRLVIKYYANLSDTGNDPVYEFQFGGSDPVRTLLPVPVSAIPSQTAEETDVDTSNFIKKGLPRKFRDEDNNVQKCLEKIDYSCSSSPLVFFATTATAGLNPETIPDGADGYWGNLLVEDASSPYFSKTPIDVNLPLDTNAGVVFPNGYLSTLRPILEGDIFGLTGSLQCKIKKVSGDKNAKFWIQVYRGNVSPSAGGAMFAQSDYTEIITSTEYQDLIIPFELSLTYGYQMTADNNLFFQIWYEQFGTGTNAVYAVEYGGLDNPFRFHLDVPSSLIRTGTAEKTPVNFYQFNRFLTSSETDVQKALKRIDDLAVINVSDLDDVQIVNPLNNQVLIYDDVGSVWRNQTQTHEIADVNGLQAALNNKIETSEKGAANGVAPLNASSKIDSTYLPSYVDDVLEFADLASFPATGETGKIYVALDTNKTYRWSGTAYVELTDDTAVWGSVSGTLSNQTDLQNALNDKIDVTEKGATNGVAPLSAGKIDNIYFDEDNILTFPTFSAFPSNPVTNTIYIDAFAEKAYRWNGVSYLLLSSVNWGDITGTLSNQTDLQNALNAKEDSIDSSTFNRLLSTTDDTAQKALDKIDDIAVSKDGESAMNGPLQWSQALSNGMNTEVFSSNIDADDVTLTSQFDSNPVKSVQITSRYISHTDGANPAVPTADSHLVNRKYVDDIAVTKENTSNKNSANGYAGLDANSQILPSALPHKVLAGPGVILQFSGTTFEQSNYSPGVGVNSNPADFGFFPVQNASFVFNPFAVLGSNKNYRIYAIRRQDGAAFDGVHCMIRKVENGIESGIPGLLDWGAGVNDYASATSDVLNSGTSDSFIWFRCYFAAYTGANQATLQDLTLWIIAE